MGSLMNWSIGITLFSFGRSTVVRCLLWFQWSDETRNKEIYFFLQSSAGRFQRILSSTTFMRKELGRHVRGGEKALTVCMPITCKSKHTTQDEHGNEVEREAAFTRFVYRNSWFVLSQTDGAEYQPEPMPDWCECTALASLGIERIAFDELDGKCQGFARKRSVAVSP